MLKKNYVASPVAHTKATTTAANAAPKAAAQQAAPKATQQAAPVADEPAYRSSSRVPTTVAELNLRVSTFSALSRSGINYVSQLTDLTARDLRKFGLSEMSIDETQQSLASFGLSLKAVSQAAESTAASYVTPPPAPKAEPAPSADEPIRKKDPNFKFCRKCGEKIRRDDVFCPECGADQR